MVISTFSGSTLSLQKFSFTVTRWKMIAQTSYIFQSEFVIPPSALSGCFFVGFRMRDPLVTWRNFDLRGVWDPTKAVSLLWLSNLNYSVVSRPWGLIAHIPWILPMGTLLIFTSDGNCWFGGKNDCEIVQCHKSTFLTLKLTPGPR